MTSLSLQDIGLQPAQLSAVRKKAKDAGTTVPELVRSLVERFLLADEPFDEILRPIRDDFRRRGITEEELDEVIDRARHKPRRPIPNSSRKTHK